MFKQVYLYDGTAVLLESVTKYRLENGEIINDVPAPTTVEKEIDVISEETGEVTKETITVYEDAPYEEIEIFNYPEEYTETKPEDGLYQPIFFDREKWIGSPGEDWESVNPPLVEESISIVEMQSIVEDLLLQMLGLQMSNSSKEA